MNMVTSIGSAGATQAAYATRTVTQSAANTEDASAAVTQDAADSGAPVATVSEESAAAARLGDQLSAQADAARVQRAVDKSTATAADSGETTETVEATGSEATQAATPAGGAAPMAAGGAGGAAASPSTTDADYIEEADTNSDKTVSDQERAVYEARQRRQAEQTAAKEEADAADPAAARTAEVRSAYGLDSEAAPALDITA